MGALDTLAKLKERNIDIALATNKGLSSLQKALAVAGVEQYFSAIRSASQCDSKPSPMMLTEIMDELQISAKDTLMVGDSVVDIEMANAAGVRAVGLHCYHEQDQIDALKQAGATKVLTSYDELRHFLQI